MSPMVNGYSIYLAPDRGGAWIVRAYRDADDTHVWSAEGLPLDEGLRVVGQKVAEDVARGAEPKVEAVIPREGF